MAGPMRAEEIEHPEDYAPRTAQGRLYEWARARHWPELNVWPPESAMYRVLHNPGRVTSTKSDGGMGERADRLRLAMATWNRVQETSEAIRMMPRYYRDVIEAMYYVEQRERPRTSKQAADKISMGHAMYRQSMDQALAWLQGRLCLYALREP